MKQKYLFGMLLSGVMLAACTADDDLKSAPVAQDVNPSAPVFSVNFGGEDLQNRATWNGSTGNVNFVLNADRMSLFNGITRPSDRTTAPTNETLAGWQNAIYLSSLSQGNGVAEWKTPSIVNDGLAVMVYPGDSIFQNELDNNNVGTEGPRVMISLDQDEKTKTLTPYMSDILDIMKNRPSNNANAADAGYNKTYDLALKKVGTNLILTLNIQPFTEVGNLANLGIEPIKVKRVEFVNNNNEYSEWDGDKAKGLFTYSVPVTIKYNSEINQVNSADGKYVRPAKYDAKNKEHLTWYAASDLDLTKAKGKNTISTTDVTERGSYVDAVFTLLPFRSDDNDNKADRVWTDFKKYGIANDIALVVYTNYGKVVMGGPGQENEQIWNGTNDVLDRSKMKSLWDGLYGIADYLWYNANNQNFFYNEDPQLTEQMGATIARSVDVIMNQRLNMNGLHVENEEELMDALTLYENLQNRAKEETIFYLDGDKNGEFIMHQETWEKVNDLYTKYLNSKDLGQVKCVPCGDAEKGKPCYNIKLVSNSTVTEVPALKLGKSQNPAQFGVTDPEKTDYAANVTLSGTWQWKDGKKAFEGVSYLQVLSGSTLDIENDIEFDGTDKPGFINNYGTVTVANAKKAVLKATTYNYSTINIGTNNARLEVSGDKVILLNSADTDSKATAFTTKYRGVINNNGHLACQAQGKGEIWNYGLINHLDPDAHTTITKNSTEETDKSNEGRNISKEFGKIFIGSIDMGYEISEYVNVKADYKGFIKLHVKEDNPSAKQIGTYVNYIVVEDGCTKLTSGKVNAGEDDEYTGWADNARHLEIANTSKEVRLYGSFVLESLVMLPETNAWLANTASLRVGLWKSGSNQSVAVVGSGCFYLKGTLDGAGTVTYTDDMTTFEGYYGGEKADVENLLIETGN